MAETVIKGTLKNQVSSTSRSNTGNTTSATATTAEAAKSKKKDVNKVTAPASATSARGTGTVVDTQGIGVENRENWNPTSTDMQSLTNALQRQYENAQYTQRTGQQRLDQANLEYSTHYDQLRRAATQQQEQNDLRLQQQRDALQASYERNRQESAQQYAQAYSQQDRALLSRGMQRSSYGMQTLGNVAAAGAAAQADIYRQQTEAENQIEDQRTQLSQQLQQTLAGYSQEQATDILKRQGELEQQDYERGVAAAERQTNIAQQLYTNLYQARRDELADAQWLAQFNEQARQYNVTNKLKTGSGMLKGDTTNTNPDTLYLRTKTEKAESASSGGGGGGGGGGGSSRKKNTANNKTSLKDDLTKKTSSIAPATHWDNAGFIV